MSPDSDPISPRARIDLAAEPDFTVGAMHVRPSACEIETDGAAQRLEPRVMQVLIAFARAGGAVVSRNDLVEACWNGVVVGEDAINRVVSKVRALAKLSDPPAFRLDTIPKIGHRLVPSETGPETAREQATQTLAVRRPFRPPVLPALVAALVVVAAGTALLWPRLPPAERTVAVSAPHRLAILPLEMEAGTRDLAYLAEGIVEEVYQRLRQVSHVELIGLTSAGALQGATADRRELGRRLGAGVLLEGGLRRDGEDGLVLDLQLIDPQTGAAIWAQGFETAVRDVATIADEIARGIADALHVAAPAFAASPGGPIENPDAYDLYLRGLAAFRRFRTDGEEGAIALLRRALDSDPTLTVARARLALAYAMHADNVMLPQGNFAAHARTLNAASETALEVLAVEPQNAVALTALAAVRMQERQYRQAETLFTHVNEIAPEEEAAFIVLSLQLAAAGYVEEARDLLAEAVGTHPASARIVSFLASFEMLLGDYESALGYAELSYLLKNPRGLFSYVLSLAALGRADEAADMVAGELATTPPGPGRDWRENFWRLTLGAFTDEAGRADYIAAVEGEISRGETNLIASGATGVLHLLGEAALYDRVHFALLETGFYDRTPLGISELWAPEASGVRASPQFKELVVRMRLVPYWKARGWPPGCGPVGADDFECG